MLLGLGDLQNGNGDFVYLRRGGLGGGPGNLQMKLTIETQTAGFLATATRNTSIAVSALSTFFAFATNMLAMYGISAPGAFSNAALIAFLSTAALAETNVPPKATAIAMPTNNRVFFFMIELLKSFTANGKGSFCSD